jgi:hypothetical protein
VERIENLTGAVRDLRSEGMALRREMRRRTNVLGWAFAGGGVMLVCCLAAAYTVSLNNQRAIEEANRKWCPMVGLLIPKPGQAPATTERGRELVASAQKLYTSFGCGVAH